MRVPQGPSRRVMVIRRPKRQHEATYDIAVDKDRDVLIDACSVQRPAFAVTTAVVCELEAGTVVTSLVVSMSRQSTPSLPPSR
jgi:hypothetical protein